MATGVDPGKYKMVRGLKDPCHATLCYHSDFVYGDRFEDFLEANYRPGEKVRITVSEIVQDEHCVALCVDPVGPVYYPPYKNLHLTMMLKGKPPVYSNELIARERKAGTVTPFGPITVEAVITIHYRKR